MSEADQERQGPEQHGGQVSEVSGLDPAQADTPISDADQVTAYPHGGDSKPDVGEETGPDARTGSDHTDFPDERPVDGLPPSD